MKKFWLSFFIILLIVLLPIGGFFVYGECIQQDVYTDTYYAELNDKVTRLSTRENKKIVFIGGSSLIFGLRSEEIEKATGYDVVDFGLYASLGTPIMMRLAEDYIKEGDVVVLAPEINSQTYSDFINQDAILKCFENMSYPINKFSIDENMSFFFHYFKYVIEKGNATIELEPPYDKASFNEYCDIDNEIVKNNIMEKYYDPTQPIEPNASLINDEFVKLVNSYNERITSKKAKLYFSFSPTNILALKDEGLADFDKSLEENLKCPVLGSVKEFTYHQYYFYDTNFHLNRTGSLLHSKNISNLLKEELKIENEYEVEVPDIPLPDNYTTGIVDTVNGMQLLQSYAGGKFNYSLVGLGDELKDVEEFRVPTSVNDIPVLSLGAAFKDMPNLKKVVVPAEVKSITDPPFENCPNCLGLYLEHPRPPKVPAVGLLNGASPNAFIYVQKQYLRAYISGYTWLEYRSVIASY